MQEFQGQRSLGVHAWWLFGHNPVALRLKELELLERIAEKIDRIQVNGSLNSILTDLIRMNP
ncbi:hypothetical protein [Nostoc sp. UHCC 0252]|uniref:hypothetical protein n=1 Tax=Nostoc sp. UHCC 0252 TaxID=3110241 RepID=UPI002B210BC2|nr:hypothetical protein [Nostoc sp. UHCC 0252]MEA5600084.1 hypothetical protein [Nostoc sp. UHCC 0252]